MTTFNQTLGAMLRTIRLSRNLTQSDVAAKLGVNRSTYSYYEIGRTMPDIHSLRQLAEVLDVPPSDFFYPERFADPASLEHRVHRTA